MEDHLYLLLVWHISINYIKNRYFTIYSANVIKWQICNAFTNSEQVLSAMDKVQHEIDQWLFKEFHGDFAIITDNSIKLPG